MRALFFKAFILCVLPDALFAGSRLTDLLNGSEPVDRTWQTPAVIKWRYNPTNAPPNAQALITAAFEIWSQSRIVDFRHEFHGTTTASSPSTNGYTDFFFGVSFSSEGLSNDLVAIVLLNGKIIGGTLRSGDEIIREGDILVNPAFSSFWRTAEADITSAAVLDLQEVLIHEIGHVLGLGHSYLIDAMMYPGKPPADLPEIDLFRFPKRSLTQDDISWAAQIHPVPDANRSYARIQGRVLYNGEPYVGAHVIAVKYNESEPHFSDDSSFLLVKGLKNVSTFSGQDGVFSLDYLEPGGYRLVVQNARNFFGWTFATVNQFFEKFSSLSSFPLDVYSNSYCATISGLSAASFSADFSVAPAFSLTANQSICGLDFHGNAPSGQCAQSPELRSGTSCGGGGCSLSVAASSGYNQDMKFLGTILFVVGSLIILLSLKSIILNRGQSKRNRPRG